MSAWLDGECPPGDPTTVQQRFDAIGGWIGDDRVGADPALLDALDACQVQVDRVGGIHDYQVDNAAKLFEAWAKARTAREIPPGDPGKVDEWRSTRDDLETITD